jgi:hypothetical protein
MVLIKNLTQTQVNGIADNFKGEVITNTDSNKLMFNNGTEFTYLVYSDLNNVITGLSGVSATNLTGTLQTAAQPNVTSLGTLNGLTVNNVLSVAQHNGVDKGLSLGGTLVTSTAAQLNYVNTTPGTAEAGKALITDGNNSIVGLTNIETDNLTVNGTLVTSSAIELNYVDVTTLGVAQASKALVVDADKNITGINTLEADYIQVNGTLVTSSAIELNYVDVATLGTAEASKALVVDANRDIGNIRNLTATNLTGTLQTAAQPNVTSVGTLTSVTVSGAASVGSLTVNGVPLNTFESGGLKMRVYSTPDFNGRVIKADVLTAINFTDYEPITGITENYSMEIWGYIKPLYTEDYTFTVSSNDKFRLWINNELVRVDWTDGTDTNLQTAPIALTANQWYPIYIQHSQSTGTEQLSIHWVSTTQVSQLLPSTSMAYDDKVVNVVARKSYTQNSLNLYDSTNSNLSSLAINSSGDLTLTAASSFVNIAGHNGSSTGLKLNNVLVTSTAAELNYLDTTTGAAAASKAVVLDANKDYAGIRNITTIGNMGINTTTPARQLEINSATGEVLRLTYDDADGTAANYADMTISSGGNLTINSSGNTTFIHSSDNLDVAGHDGSTLGLKLAGILVTATAAELNYVDTTAGAAEASKALVLDSSRDITNINSLSTSTLTSISTTDSTTTTTGAITTAGGVGIVKSVNIGQTLTVGGDTTLSANVTSTGVLTLSNVTDSTTTTTGAVKIAGGVGIVKSVNIGQTLTVGGDTTLSANVVVTGPSFKVPVGDTANRPTGALGQVRYNSETSQFEGFGAGSTWGSLGGVSDVDQNTKILAEASAGANDNNLRFINDGTETMRLTAASLMGLGTTAPAKKLEINSATGDVLRLTYNDSDGSATNYVDMNVSSGGNLTINSSGNTTLIHSSDNFDVAGHDGSTLGLRLAGVLVTSTAAELNYVDVTAIGTAQASKALVLDANRDITNINVLTADTVNVTTFGAGALTADTINTTGNVGINTTDLTFGLQVNAADGNILRLTYNDDTSATPTSKAELTMDNSNNLTISASSSVNIATHNGSTTGLKLAGTLITSTAAELNYVDTTAGTAEASKALILDSSRDITNINSLSASTLTSVATTDSTSSTTGAVHIAGGVGIAKSVFIGAASSGYLELSGNASFNGDIGSTGVLTLSNATDSTTTTTGAVKIAGGVGIVKSVNIGQTLTVGGNTTLSSNLIVDGPSMRVPVGDTAARPTGVLGQVRYNSETSQFEGFGAGSTWGSLGGVSDVDQDTKILAETSAGADDDNLRFLNAGNETMRLTAASLMGLGTTAPDKKLEINSATGDVLRLTYNDANGSATNYVDMNVSSGGNLTINSSGNTTFIHSSDNFDIAGHNGSTLGLMLNGTLVTSTAAELNYVDTTAGTAEASKALVLDSSRNITNINSISMSSLNLTFDSATANTAGNPLTVTRTTSGTPANGLGVGVSFKVENSANANVEFGNIAVVSSDITTTTEDGQFVVNLLTNGVMTEAMRLSSSTMYVTELYEVSDVRMKENIIAANLQETHNRVMNINLVDYSYIGQEKVHRGVLAQEIETIIPAAVETSERNGFSDFKTVSTREVSNHLVGSVQYLSAKLDETLARLEKLSEDFEAYKQSHP